MIISWFPVMRKVWSPISLRIALCLLLVFCCAYDCYNDIMEADFLTLGKKYEAQDVGNLLIDKKNLTGGSPQPFSSFTLLENNFGDNLPVSSFLFPLIPLTSILRC